MSALGFVGGHGMSDLITMDDLSNDEILEILDTAEKVVAGCKWRCLRSFVAREGSRQLIL